VKYLVVIDHGYHDIGTYEFEKIDSHLLELLSDNVVDVEYFVSVKEELNVTEFLAQHYNALIEINEAIRGRALAKLTQEEKDALGL
jgi:hypothetical protein